MSLTRDKLTDALRSRRQTTSTTQPQVNSSSIGDMINSESTTTRNMKISNQLDKLMKKHDIRLRMAKGEISSGNKGVDKLENARSSLADYARSEYLKQAEKDPSMDLNRLEKMQDQDIIDWMTKDDPQARIDYVNFINKGGFVKDAYNKIMGIDEETLKEEKIKNSGLLNNLAGSFVNNLGNKLAGAVDILNDKTGVIDWLSDKEGQKEEYEGYIDPSKVSTELYNKWVKGEISDKEMKDIGPLGLYNDYYNDTVENKNFQGSIEDYGKYWYDKKMGYLNKSAQEKWKEDMPIVYDPEGNGSGVGDFGGETTAFLTLPGGKKKFLTNILLGTAEILGMDMLDKGKIPEWGELKEDAMDTGLVTTAVETALRLPKGVTNLVKGLRKVSPEVRNSMTKTSKKEWNHYGNVASKGLSSTKKEAVKYLDSAGQSIKHRLDKIGDKLGKMRDNLDGDFKYQDIWDSINNRFKKFEEKGRGEGKAPEIIVDKADNMFIKNEEALSNKVDSDGVKILDYLRSEYNAFKNQGRGGGARDAEELMRKIKSRLDEAIDKEKIDMSDPLVRDIKGALEDAYETLYKASDNVVKGQGAKFKELRKQYSRTKQYQKFFEKYIGNIKGGGGNDKLMNDLKQLEKDADWGQTAMSKGEDTLGRFFNILKKDKVIKEDLGAKLTSLIYAFALKNPKQLQSLIDNIYPSIPGIMELGLSLGRNKIKGVAAKSMLKKSEDEVLRNVNQKSVLGKLKIANKTIKKTDKKRGVSSKRYDENMGWVNQTPYNVWETIAKDVQGFKNTINKATKPSNLLERPLRRAGENELLD